MRVLSRSMKAIQHGMRLMHTIKRTIVTDITTFPKKLPELCGIIAVAGKNYVTITQGHAFYFYHYIQKAEVCTC